MAMQKRDQFRNFRSAGLLLAVLLLMSSCAGPSGGVRERGRQAPPTGRFAVRVEARQDGRFELDGEELRMRGLVKRLRREGAGRAVVLSGSEGVSDRHLLILREQLVREGVPNVVIARARVAVSSVEDPED